MSPTTEQAAWTPITQTFGWGTVDVTAVDGTTGDALDLNLPGLTLLPMPCRQGFFFYTRPQYWAMLRDRKAVFTITYDDGAVKTVRLIHDTLVSVTRVPWSLAAIKNHGCTAVGSDVHNMYIYSADMYNHPETRLKTEQCIYKACDHHNLQRDECLRRCGRANMRGVLCKPEVFRAYLEEGFAVKVVYGRDPACFDLFDRVGNDTLRIRSLHSVRHMPEFRDVFKDQPTIAGL